MASFPLVACFYDHLLQHIKYYWIAWGFLYTARKRKRKKPVSGVSRKILQFNDNPFLSSCCLFQKCRQYWPALDQKRRQRIGQLSNGIDLTTQQVQQIPTEWLPLDEHSEEVSKLFSDKLWDVGRQLSRRMWMKHHAGGVASKIFNGINIFILRNSSIFAKWKHQW